MGLMMYCTYLELAHNQFNDIRMSILRFTIELESLCKVTCRFEICLPKAAGLTKEACFYTVQSTLLQIISFLFRFS